MYSLVVIINNPVLCAWNLLKELILNILTKKTNKQKGNCETLDVLIHLAMGLISQCTHTSDHHIVHFKYITILLVNYTSVKLGEMNYLRIKNYTIQGNPWWSNGQEYTF